MYIPGKQWLTFGNGRLQADNYRRIRRIISNYCFKIYLVRRNGTNRFLLLFLTSLQFSSSSSPYCDESISAMCAQMGLFIRRLPSRQKKSVFEGWVVGFSVLRRRRQFGLLKVTSEWSLLCSQHSNLIEYAWCITISTVVGSILTNYITLTTWQREYLFDLFLLSYETRKDCLRILFCSVFRKNSQEF